MRKLFAWIVTTVHVFLWFVGGFWIGCSMYGLGLFFGDRIFGTHNFHGSGYDISEAHAVQINTTAQRCVLMVNRTGNVITTGTTNVIYTHSGATGGASDGTASFRGNSSLWCKDISAAANNAKTVSLTFLSSLADMVPSHVQYDTTGWDESASGVNLIAVNGSAQTGGVVNANVTKVNGTNQTALDLANYLQGHLGGSMNAGEHLNSTALEAYFASLHGSSSWDAAGAGLDAAGVRDALGMAAANMDTQLGLKLNTSAYIAPLDATATENAVWGAAKNNHTNVLTFGYLGATMDRVLDIHNTLDETYSALGYSSGDPLAPHINAIPGSHDNATATADEIDRRRGVGP